MKLPGTARLSDLFDGEVNPSGRFRVAMICPDLIGPVKNGGVGTANTHLAMALADSGATVSILFTGSTSKDSEGWRFPYTTKGIQVSTVDDLVDEHYPPRSLYPSHHDVRAAYLANEWLKGLDVDLVLVNDWRGHGYLALLARQSGVAHRSTPFVLVAHGPSIWHDMHSASVKISGDSALCYLLERKSVELADAVVSPSRYMLEWMREHSIILPPLNFVQPNVLPSIKPPGGMSEQRPGSMTVAYLGRLEDRKGLLEFCSAIELAQQHQWDIGRVCFLGKPGLVGDRNAVEYLISRTHGWQYPVYIEPNLDHDGVLTFIAREVDLVVVPSIMDNSPYTVYETLHLAVPLIARDVGGIRELISEGDHPKSLYTGSPMRLAELIQQALTQPFSRSQLAFDVDENTKAWCDGLRALAREASRHRQSGLSKAPSVTVCMSHHDRPTQLKRALEGLFAQTDQDFELILVDDGSSLPESRLALDSLERDFGSRGWQIIRTPNRYVGAARNSAAAVAQGEYLLFVDDDNIPRPEMVEAFKSAAQHSAADIVTCAFDVFSGSEPAVGPPVSERYMPLGDALSLASYRNYIGDANSLVRAAKFNRVGGFSEDFGVGHEDLELLARMLLSGATVAVVPEPLFWYRRAPDSMLSSTDLALNWRRSLRPLMEMTPPYVYEGMVLLGSLMLTLDQPSAVGDMSPLAELLAREVRSLGDPNGSDARRALEILQAWRAGPRVVIGKLSEGCDASRAEAEPLGVQTIATLARLAAVTSPTEVSRCVSHLESIRPNDILAWLSACQLAVEKSDFELAARALGRAVTSGSQEYVSKRTDLQEAITQGVVESALDHYMRFGRLEGASWPMQSQLAQVVGSSGVLRRIDSHVVEPRARREFHRIVQVVDMTQGEREQSESPRV